MASSKTVTLAKFGLAAALGAAASLTITTFNATTIQTTGTITTASRIIQSGGIIPITGSLTLSEVHGVASGALSIQNPLAKDLFCDQFVADITTAAAPETIVDIGTATGSVAAGTASGVDLFDALALSVRTITSSGSAVRDGGGHVKVFKLNAAGGATDYIQIKSLSGTGAGLVGTYRLNCFYPR